MDMRNLPVVFAAGLLWLAASAAADTTPTVDGAVIYERHCAACHGADGRGVMADIPTLRFDAATWEDTGAVIRSVLRGSHRRAMGIAMPDHGFLGNESVAAVLTYVRRTFGRDDGSVAIEDVARTRLELVQRYHDEAAASEAEATPLVGLERPPGRWDPPPMSPAAYQRARANYEQLCTGCHGVFRTGTAGNPLHPEWMRELGTEYLRHVIGFGTARGMPDWLDAHGLGPEQVTDLALFLQHPIPPPAAMDSATIRGSWTLHRPLDERPTAPAHEHALEELFVVALHDPGSVLLIHGPSLTPVIEIDVGGPPHRITASASGRYLQVVARNGVVSLIDLYAGPPERVASVRVGYEARAVAASRGPERIDRFVLAGSEWPPQLVLLDGRTLEPLQRLDTHLDPDETMLDIGLGDILGSPWADEFVAVVRLKTDDTGSVLFIPEERPLPFTLVDTAPALRSGALAAGSRHLLLPSDGQRLVVVDLLERGVVAEHDLPFAGAGNGVTYLHDRFGPVWVTGSMVSDLLAVVAADPDGDAPFRVIETVDAPAAGSLFLATHPNSRHLWIDTPLADIGHASHEVAVYQRDALADGYRSLPIAGWADIEEGPRRVLQPTYSADGSEVWLLVWNTQDEESAIVVVEDATLEPRAVLRLPQLVTPMRIYSVAALTAAATPLALPADPDGAEDDVAAGIALFQAHCAGCHGVYGQGDGPVAPHLDVTLKDLRDLTARSDGEFPEAYVRRIVDGREMRAEHGPAGKPVWGEVFSAEAASTEAGEALARSRLDDIVRFLRALQRSTP